MSPRVASEVPGRVGLVPTAAATTKAPGQTGPRLASFALSGKRGLIWDVGRTVQGGIGRREAGGTLPFPSAYRRLVGTFVAAAPEVALGVLGGDAVERPS